MKTLSAAIDLAKKEALHFGYTFYVIATHEDQLGPYAVVDDEDLETFFSATPEKDILFCTDD